MARGWRLAPGLWESAWSSVRPLMNCVTQNHTAIDEFFKKPDSLLNGLVLVNDYNPPVRQTSLSLSHRHGNQG